MVHDTSSLVKSFTDIDADHKQITLSFNTIDIYGNPIDDETVCSFFSHSRYVIYFDIDYKLLDDIEIFSYSYSFLESFNPSTYLKEITISTTHLVPSLVYDKINLNYTIVDGLTIYDGLRIKYYANNNF